MNNINNLDALLNIVRINDLFDWLKVYAKKHPDFGKQLASYIEKEYIREFGITFFEKKEW